MIILAILLVGIAARQGEAADPAAPVAVTANGANLGAPNKIQFDPLGLSSASSSDRRHRPRSRAPVAITPDGTNPGAPNELPDFLFNMFADVLTSPQLGTTGLSRELLKLSGMWNQGQGAPAFVTPLCGYMFRQLASARFREVLSCTPNLLRGVVSSLKSPRLILSLLTKASPMALLHIAYSSKPAVRTLALQALAIEAALLYLYFSAMDAVSQPGRLAMLSTLTFVPSLAVSALRPAAFIAKKLGMSSIVKGVSTVMKRYGTSFKIVFSAASIPFILGTASSLLGGQYHQTSMAMGIQTSLLMFAAYTLQTFQEQSLHLE